MFLLRVIESFIFIPTAFSVGYISIFSIASLFQKKKHSLNYTNQPLKFCIIFPAYAEDAVILDSINTFMNQSYPKDLFDVIVVSDHMQDETNQILHQLPLKCLIANYDNSSKAKALQLASKFISNDNDYVVILDADNVVETDFLYSLNKRICKPTPIAYQCHRQAKNRNTPTAILDAASEEINNSIFRRGHNNLGIASALIGSGMCFEKNWFVEHVSNLKTSGEDKELEAMLLAEGQFIEYIDEIPVYDEKTNNPANFSKQRRRWMAAQFTSCAAMILDIHYNIGYLDKIIQQMILPRSLCIGISVIMLFTLHSWWILLFVVLCISLIIALPRNFWHIKTLKAFSQLPMLILRMGINLFKLRGQSNKFIHTTHVGS